MRHFSNYISIRIFENVTAKWTFSDRQFFMFFFFLAKAAVIKTKSATTVFFFFFFFFSFLSPRSFFFSFLFSFASVILELVEPKKPVF